MNSEEQKDLKKLSREMANSAVDKCYLCNLFEDYSSSDILSKLATQHKCLKRYKKYEFSEKLQIDHENSNPETAENKIIEFKHPDFLNDPAKENDHNEIVEEGISQYKSYYPVLNEKSDETLFEEIRAQSEKIKKILEDRNKNKDIFLEPNGEINEFQKTEEQTLDSYGGIENEKIQIGDEISNTSFLDLDISNAAMKNNNFESEDGGKSESNHNQTERNHKKRNNCKSSYVFQKASFNIRTISRDLYISRCIGTTQIISVS